MSKLTEFKKALEGKEFYILDTETTGKDDGEIVQIALVHSSGKVILDSHVKPTASIPQDATRIHGITDNMVANAPSFPEIAENLKHVLEGKILVVWNAIYDRKMMHKSLERHNLEKIEWKEICEWHCAMEAFAEFFGEWNDYHKSYRWQRLSTAARFCRVEVKDTHSALGDCIITLGVTKFMLEHDFSVPKSADEVNNETHN